MVFRPRGERVRRLTSGVDTLHPGEQATPKVACPQPEYREPDGRAPLLCASAGRRLGPGSGHCAGSSVVSAAQTPELRDGPASGTRSPNPGCSPHSARSTEERGRGGSTSLGGLSASLGSQEAGPSPWFPPSQTPSHSWLLSRFLHGLSTQVNDQFKDRDSTSHFSRCSEF